MIGKRNPILGFLKILNKRKMQFVERWLFSTNHKDIGTMYIIFAIIAEFIGGGFSVFMRMELMQPGIQYMSDGHMWNVFTTAHGLIMVFFVVMPGLIGGFGNWFVPILSLIHI